MPILGLQRHTIYQNNTKIYQINEDLAELSKFDIAALIEGDNSVFLSPLF